MRKNEKLQCGDVSKSEDIFFELTGCESCDDVKALILQKPHLLGQNKSGQNLLHLAVTWERTDLVGLLIEQYPDLLTMKDSQGCLPLHLAASYHGHIKILKILLKAHHFQLNEKNQVGHAALHLAAQKNQIKKAVWLINQGASLIVKDKLGLMPIDIAAEANCVDVVSTLLKRHAEQLSQDISTAGALFDFMLMHYHANTVMFVVNQRSDLFQKTNQMLGLLPAAENKKRVDVVEKILLSSSPYAGELGYTPLHLAAFSYRVPLSIITLLWQSGANLNMTDNNGRTPLHFAAMSLHTDISRIDALLNLGADLRAKDQAGCMPLHFAIKNCGISVVNFLLEKDAALSSESDGSGNSPLHLMVERREFTIDDIIAFAKRFPRLLKHKNNLRRMPLYTAVTAWKGRGDIVMALVEAGADETVIDSDGNSVLHVAVQHYDFKKISYLAKAFPDLCDKRNENGHTPLHIAAAQWDVRAVNFFIELGVDHQLITDVLAWLEKEWSSTSEPSQLARWGAFFTGYGAGHSDGGAKQAILASLRNALPSTSCTIQ